MNHAYLTLIEHLSSIYPPIRSHYDLGRCLNGDNTVSIRNEADTNLSKVSLRLLLVLMD